MEKLGFWTGWMDGRIGGYVVGRVDGLLKVV